MEIVLGVSMTPTTVRMVLVEGEKADGLTVDHDVFDITAVEGAATSSAPDQVIAAILGTQESATSGGHRLVSTGVTWSDRAGAATLREALAARRIDDVLLVSELHAAAALAQAVGRTVGYDTTALMFIDRDTATLSVVETADGSIVKVDSQSLHSTDAMAVLTEMVASLQARASQPEGMYVVGSGVDVTSVKEHLEHLVSIPVSAPEEPELALARGAALAAAHAPLFDASTVGLAYSEDPDGTTAGEAYAVGLAAADTQLAPVGYRSPSIDEPEPVAKHEEDAQEGRKPFLLVGSSLTGIFVVGVVALVISLAVSIRPTVDTRPNPGESANQPVAPPAPPAVQDAQPAGPPPAPETIKAPVPVVQEQQAPRTVVVEAPKQAPAPAPAAPAPAPPPAAEPAPPPAGPPPGEVPPYPAPQYPPVYVPPAPVYVPPPAYVPPPVIQLPPPRLPPILRPPRERDDYWPQQPWNPPSQQPWNPPSQQPWNPPSQQPQSPSSQQPLWPPSGSGGSGSGGSGSSGWGGSGSISSGGSGSSGSDGSGGSGRSDSGGTSPLWPWPSH